jgi:hypothetical protein
VKLPNIKFYENPFSGSQVVVYGWTDRVKLVGPFVQLLVANAPKKEHQKFIT